MDNCNHFFSFYPPRIATGLLTLLVMRVIYIIKALQIIVAVVVLFRLINVGKFCENRQVTSRSECLGTMKLAIPPLNTDLSLRDAEKSVKTAEPNRHPRMSPVLTKKDQSLEEAHEENLRRRKGQLNVMEQPDLVSTPKPAAESKSASHSKQPALSPQALPVMWNKAESFPAEKSHEQATVLKTTGKAQKEHAPAKRDLKEVKEETNVKEHKQEELKKEVKEKESSVKAKSQEDTNKVTSKSSSTKTTKKVKPEYEKRALRLENNIVNCLQISSPDLFGFGSIGLSQTNAYRVCIVCLVVSIFGIALSVLHHYINLAPPPRCRVLIESICQIALFGVCSFALFLIRHEWENDWSNVSGGTFEPDYPSSWFCSELICYVMIVAFLLESFFYDYAFCKVRVEESLGSYTMVDRPEYFNSIYGTTLEPTEDNEL
ncbi:unnamed protein product [Cylicocyclus nassatus]|uniref:Uncharacterized protein n=1 Tax=Cylicocyclus nassatus TaxID=53992 RepID=A0AA36GJU0_CYLNA|nr:unnamed protein product [Cylicocyclus nassatus]